MNDEKFIKDLEMLKYFQDEFIYRHKHYWSILNKFFLLIVIVDLMPFVSEIVGITLADNVNGIQIVFPVFGIIASVMFMCIIRGEKRRMNSVRDSKYEISKQMDELYKYDPSIMPEKNKGMADMLAISVGLIEIILSVASLIMCINLYIAPITDIGFMIRVWVK